MQNALSGFAKANLLTDEAYQRSNALIVKRFFHSSKVGGTNPATSQICYA
jgi:hypothetical protein